MQVLNNAALCNKKRGWGRPPVAEEERRKKMRTPVFTREGGETTKMNLLYRSFDMQILGLPDMKATHGDTRTPFTITL